MTDSPVSIMVVPTKVTNDFTISNKGIILENQSCFDIMRIISSNMLFMPRTPELENDESWQQIIPYVAVYHVDSDGERHYLMYCRKAGDTRLLTKYSIGFGGHIDLRIEFDHCSFNDIIEYSLYRELVEEVPFTKMGIFNTCYTKERLEFVGHIYERDTAIGRVHFGLGYSLLVDKDYIDLTGLSDENKDGKNLQWVPESELTDKTSNKTLEGWSELLLQGILANDC